MRLFRLIRDADTHGQTGLGFVAEGVQFSDGTVALRWTTGQHHSTGLFSSIDALRHIHGHEDTTRVIWIHGKEEP